MKSVDISSTLFYFAAMAEQQLRSTRLTRVLLFNSILEKQVRFTYWMLDSQGFKTIAADVTAEISVKGSRFITHAAPVNAQPAAEEFIRAVSHRFYDATHNCFAYKIGIGDAAVFRFSDDGEPSGTAGRPMLQALETRGLSNLVAVVTRYFGGTKLGTGGLIRAYSAAVFAALDQAKVVVSYPQIILTLTFDYPFTNAVHQVIDRHSAVILKTDFDEGNIYRVRLDASKEAEFRAALRDATGGKIKLS